ncbi:UDP-4-amino-4,6-dideoxy-N-acetyl-beta-L-altrosamine N-acetyltransferase [Promethearchaeum syntrophicum]|uniref:UDP-4-amino-4, 6-dideoxy-N-acetyl-beta-L-altrosamine N-acetyltransferase n=1 Tax=Promethearchaeum syntrophicum TaxID=2594042 RepID=A0A5B9DBJ2_9ARCH|nr:UDP-4-amino-4,6-dideoxy-N-acetyl-beta-L-altrosamine N-acetyltransferase [Candidatus Prometheoarchaeum syntrophicum]QEE16026.1 ribosomal-protein-L7/L12-serine acetyltransferase [Candidatus Prometheoarchaeum syntrophicum]
MDLQFKRLNEKYLEKVRNWRNNSEISQYMYTNHEITKEEHLNWYHNYVQKGKIHFWIVILNGIPIGAINISNIDKVNKRCFWAYYLADSSVRGKGLGKIIELNVYKYVFEEMKMNKLCCEVLKSNDIVVKIHQKYGSVIEGVFKQHIFKNGHFQDIVCMAIIQSSWEEKKIFFNFPIIAFEK